MIWSRNKYRDILNISKYTHSTKTNKKLDVDNSFALQYQDCFYMLTVYVWRK